jgi:hypothetical protein
MRDRRGLEVIAFGDPVLVTEWSSVLLAAAEPKARAWHDWLASEAALLHGVWLPTAVPSR